MEAWTKRLAFLLAVLFLGFGVTVGIACGDGDLEDSPTVSASPDPQADPDPEADPDPVADPDPEAGGGEGVVSPRPDGATQVDVTLKEWEVVPAQANVAAGTIYFLVTNVGPEDPHEFVVVRTDLDPEDLPVDEGRIPESDVDLVDEIEAFLPGSSASIALNLEAGSYVLLCNIVERENRELESHFELGMRAAFTVE